MMLLLPMFFVFGCASSSILTDRADGGVSDGEGGGVSAYSCRGAGLSAWHDSAYGEDADYSEYSLDRADDGLRYDCEAAIHMTQDRQPVPRQEKEKPAAPYNNPYDLPQM